MTDPMTTAATLATTKLLPRPLDTSYTYNHYTHCPQQEGPVLAGSYLSLIRLHTVFRGRFEFHDAADRPETAFAAMPPPNGHPGAYRGAVGA